jgi:hypothetical protein
MTMTMTMMLLMTIATPMPTLVLFPSHACHLQCCVGAFGILQALARLSLLSTLLRIVPRSAMPQGRHTELRRSCFERFPSDFFSESNPFHQGFALNSQ